MVRLGRRGVVRLTRGRGCVLVIKGRGVVMRRCVSITRRS